MNTPIPFRDLPHEEQMQLGENYGAAYNRKLPEYRGYCTDHGWARHFTKTKKCVFCGKASGRPYSKNPRAVARREGEKEYIDRCDVHGMTAHSVGKGKCLSCFTTMGAHRESRAVNFRALARSTGSSAYMDDCTVHGEALHDVARGQCLTCFTTAGTPRIPKVTTPRTEARRAGDKTYRGDCAVHGEVPHDTAKGNCMSCFTTMGIRRVVTEAPVNARSAARRARETTYWDECPLHGKVPHSVKHGLCLGCFTVSGAIRQDGEVVRSPRAEARRAGGHHYEAHCEKHGTAPHAVSHGRCLRCYTTAGALRAPPRSYPA